MPKQVCKYCKSVVIDLNRHQQTKKCKKAQNGIQGTIPIDRTQCEFCNAVVKNIKNHHKISDACRFQQSKMLKTKDFKEILEHTKKYQLPCKVPYLQDGTYTGSIEQEIINSGMITQKITKISEIVNDDYKITTLGIKILDHIYPKLSEKDYLMPIFHENCVPDAREFCNPYI